MPISRGFRNIALLVVAAIVIGVALWTWIALSYSYSEGDRAGVLQKFSKKGWICKTYEGELAQYIISGVTPQIWYFSTRDETLAKKLSASVGQKVQIHYNEHRGVPTSCFAETQYFAESITVMQ